VANGFAGGKAFAGALVALADVKSQYFVFFWGKSVPTPSFLLLSFAHK
jgi:hypothetical protein